jgi:hypothetical protein
LGKGRALRNRGSRTARGVSEERADGEKIKRGNGGLLRERNHIPDGWTRMARHETRDRTTIRLQPQQHRHRGRAVMRTGMLDR